MALILNLDEGTRFWRCDACGVETTNFSFDAMPQGWGRDEYPGGPHHWCPECLITEEIDVGDPEKWQAAWDAL